MNPQVFLCLIMLIAKPIIAVGQTFFFNVQTQNSQVQVPRGKKLLFIGDSLAQGMAPHFNKLARNKGYIPHINCLQGTRIDYWSDRLDKIVNNIRPGLIVISLGTNDSGLPTPESQRRHVKNIKKIADRYGSKILWILPQPLPKRFVGQHGIKQIIKEEIKDDVYDTQVKLEKIKDEIHLTSKGYETWITATWDHMVVNDIVEN